MGFAEQILKEQAAKREGVRQETRKSYVRWGRRDGGSVRKAKRESLKGRNKQKCQFQGDIE